MKVFTLHRAFLYLATSALLLMSTPATHAQNSQEQEPFMTDATYIPFEAKSGEDKNFVDFLTEGAKLVAQTEPNTLYDG